VGSHAGSRNNHFDTAVFGSFGEYFHFSWRTMGGQSVHFERDLHLVKQFSRFFHYGQVRGTAHDNAYYRCHFAIICSYSAADISSSSSEGSEIEILINHPLPYTSSFTNSGLSSSSAFAS